MQKGRGGGRDGEAGTGRQARRSQASGDEGKLRCRLSYAAFRTREAAGERRLSGRSASRVLRCRVREPGRASTAPANANSARSPSMTARIASSGSARSPPDPSPARPSPAQLHNSSFYRLHTPQRTAELTSHCTISRPAHVECPEMAIARHITRCRLLAKTR